MSDQQPPEVDGEARNAFLRSLVSAVLMIVGATLATVGIGFAVSVWAGVIFLGLAILVVGVLFGMT